MGAYKSQRITHLITERYFTIIATPKLSIKLLFYVFFVTILYKEFFSLSLSLSLMSKIMPIFYDVKRVLIQPWMCLEECVPWNATMIIRWKRPYKSTKINFNGTMSVRQRCALEGIEPGSLNSFIRILATLYIRPKRAEKLSILIPINSS